MNRNRSILFISLCGLAFSWTSALCQTEIPEVLNKGSLPEQMKYLEEKTRIYENYRAIREDMFQKIKGNTLDSLTSAKGKISAYVALTGTLNSRISSLRDSLASTQADLNETTRTKNNISILGMGMNKTAYNSIMWTILAVMIFLLAAGFLIFKRNLVATSKTKNELEELKKEFEGYRQKTRLEREKMSMDHFNEIRKLRGG